MKGLIKWIIKSNPIPFYFQLIHALGLFTGAAIFSFVILYIFPVLNEYAKAVLLMVWGLLILFTLKLAVKSWKKGFLIATGFLLILYIYLIT